MPRIAWAWDVNAYNHIEKGEAVYNKNGIYLGTATGYKSRCTATKLGSVELDNKTWISSLVYKIKDGWKLS